MRPFIDLYIDNEKIEFSEPPQILFTYAHTELHNPTVVKNSFSKTLTIDGTPKNNQIFGCFGDMNRVVSYADGKYLGAYFNPSRKIDFMLCRNNEPIERGYVKLDKVVKKGKNLQYEITLYGGLGQFLYNLTYGNDGEQLKLSDLEYGYDLNLEVTHNTVRDAWNYINNIESIPMPIADNSSIYEFLNFAPCYNGIPSDFSADKVAINTNMYSGVWETTKDGYGTVNGWILGELPKEYDEWQTKDLRCYLQRPVIRFKEIINACCNPVNNGGYDVELDADFFTESNPYYNNAWMTLPLVSEMEDDEVVNDADVSVGETITISGMTLNQDFNITVLAEVGCKANSTASKLQTCYDSTSWDGSDESSPVDMSTNFARYIQLVAYDASGNVIGGSNINSYYTNNFWTGFEYEPVVKTSINRVTGYYYRNDDGTYSFNKKYYDYTIKNLKYSEGMYFKFVEKFAYDSSPSMSWPDDKVLYTPEYGSVNVATYTKGVDENVEVVQNKGLSWFLKKDTALNSENTPCDYFLNYLKMFNLHIWSDNVDKKIYIKQRKNYFSNERVNLDKQIDRSSEMTITPITFDAKYYVFNNVADNESQLNKLYKDTYGFDYGVQKINTNYNFDNSSKELMENGIFKTAICYRGKSKYYADMYLDDWSADNPVPSFVVDGIKTYLFKGDDTTEGKYITPKTTINAVSWYNTKYLDLFPKPDFRDKDGKGVDGANVLLFYNGKQEMKNVDGDYMDFFISDDIPEFEELNDGEPCWIMGGYGDYAVQMNNLPVFSRYITNENGWITHSWDFGTPKELYIDGWSIDDSSNIYTQYWKPYMTDELDVNTRVVECKVRFKEKVNPDYLMKFVYFDNCYWKIQEIVDYDVTTANTTKVKMVKINDLNNYLT